jgi:hypothetical protein
MKTVTLRLPEALVAEIAAESRRRKVSKSDVMRERLQSPPLERSADPLAAIRDLIGSVKDDHPTDVSARADYYLRASGYGKNGSR